ncbi:MAG TPA: 23S rRNA (guanosine(2251)-2'-O)-methyltransferase RlmB [Casimicrobiaceae bacterium]
MPALASTRSLCGFHAVTARLRRHAAGIEALYVDASRHDPRMRELVARASGAGVPVHRVEAGRIDALAHGALHQGVVALVGADEAPATLGEVLASLAEPALLLVLDGVTDPHNLGACLRNADAFGAQAVIVPKDRAAGITATVASAASGAAETIPLVAVTNLARALQELKDAGVWVVGAEQGGESIVDADLTGPIAWVLGAEGKGLRRLTRDTCDRLVGIPMSGTVQSLNVSVAAGVCLYATRATRLRATGPIPRVRATLAPS